MVDVIQSPALVIPPPKPDVHEGTIQGIAHLETPNGAHAITVILKSNNTGQDDEFQIWVPASLAEEFDTIMSDPTLLQSAPAIGKKQSERQQFGRAIKNSRQTGQVEKLLRLATSQGRAPSSTEMSTFSEYIAFLNDMLAGLDVVYTRAADTNPQNPDFADRLRVKAIFPPSASSGTFAGYTKRWEVAEEQEVAATV